MAIRRNSRKQDEQPVEAVDPSVPVFDADGVDQFGRTRQWYELFAAEHELEIPAED
jgi:hypothetical protein